jgi:arylsulfatase A-like enzyme
VAIAVALLAACTTSGTNSKSPGVVTVPAGTIVSRPNIVFILTDDLSDNLVRYMPHVQAMMRSGASFSKYFVTDSLCCPSRASIFTGLYPHDTHVFTNWGLDGGFWTFNRFHNPDRTFAVALQQSGYRTALMGKYLNGYEPDIELHSARPYVPKGWNDWAAAGNAYHNFNYFLNENHRVVHYGRSPRAYLTDVLSRRAQEYIARSATPSNLIHPFTLEIATYAPHFPYVPAPRDDHRFNNVRAPRTEAFNHATAGSPPWFDLPPLSSHVVSLIDRDFRRRVRSVQAVDRMIGAVQRQVFAKGLAANTYFVFSSDNGYHMGEHRLGPGKQTAFDTDIKVPLVITGPGIRPGTRINSLAENIDLAPTFEDLAGHTPSPSVEGRSLVPLLEGKQPADWRKAVLVEHRGPDSNPADPDFQLPGAGNPPAYDAIRLANETYVEYANGHHEYYNLATDPFELRNTYTDLSVARRHELHRAVLQFKRCHGAAECHQADQLLPSG